MVSPSAAPCAGGSGTGMSVVSDKRNVAPGSSLRLGLWAIRSYAPKRKGSAPKFGSRSPPIIWLAIWTEPAGLGGPPLGYCFFGPFAGRQGARPRAPISRLLPASRFPGATPSRLPPAQTGRLIPTCAAMIPRADAERSRTNRADDEPASISTRRTWVGDTGPGRHCPAAQARRPGPYLRYAKGPNCSR